MSPNALVLHGISNKEIINSYDVLKMYEFMDESAAAYTNTSVTAFKYVPLQPMYFTDINIVFQRISIYVWLQSDLTLTSISMHTSKLNKATLRCREHTERL